MIWSKEIWVEFSVVDWATKSGVEEQEKWRVKSTMENVVLEEHSPVLNGTCITCGLSILDFRKRGSLATTNPGKFEEHLFGEAGWNVSLGGALIRLQFTSRVRWVADQLKWVYKNQAELLNCNNLW